jgi:hypothetical protein
MNAAALTPATPGRNIPAAIAVPGTLENTTMAKFKFGNGCPQLPIEAA